MAKRIREKKDLRDLALFYCSKRETSRAKLGSYLQRKCRAQEVDEPSWIEEILNDFERLKVIDDDRYGGILVREYERRGKGKRYIEQKLMEKGISKEKHHFENDPASEEVRAIEVGQKLWEKILKQKIKIPKNAHVGPSTETFLRKQKLMQKLVTAGYSFDLAKKVAQQVTGAPHDPS